MTNELTKQYRKGTLPSGFYYLRSSIGQTYAVDYHNVGMKGLRGVEVLSEIPSFEEYEKLSSKVLQLEKELSDAEEYCDYSITNRKQLTKQINHWMDKCDQLEKRLDIAVKGLKFISSQSYGKDMYDCAKGTLKQLEELEK